MHDNTGVVGVESDEVRVVVEVDVRGHGDGADPDLLADEEVDEQAVWVVAPKELVRSGGGIMCTLHCNRRLI